MKILSFGSLNIDQVYELEQIVSPGMTAEASACTRTCGGKGLNQSTAIAKAGAEVFHAGAVGTDGDMLLSFLRSCGVHTEHVAITDTPTGHAIIQVDRAGDNSIIILGGANRQIDEGMIRSVLADFSEGDYIVLQNEISNLPLLIRLAHSKGMIVCFTPSPITGSLSRIPFELVHYLFINEIEGQLISGVQEPEKVLSVLTRKYPNCAIILTLGKNGVIYSGTEGVHTHGIFPAEVVDTTGAGDTFCGFFIASVSRGTEIPEALKIASMASSLCVSRPGAAQSIPSREEVIHSLQGRSGDVT